MSQKKHKKRKAKKGNKAAKPKPLTKSQSQQAVLGELWERMGRNSAQIVRISYLVNIWWAGSARRWSSPIKTRSSSR